MNPKNKHKAPRYTSRSFSSSPSGRELERAFGKAPQSMKIDGDEDRLPIPLLNFVRFPIQEKNDENAQKN